MSWLDVLRTLFEAINTLWEILGATIDGDTDVHRQVDTAGQQRDIVAQLAVLATPGAMRGLSTGTGDALRVALTDVLHSQLRLMRVLQENVREIEGARKQLVAVAEEAAAQAAPAPQLAPEPQPEDTPKTSEGS